VKPPRSGAVPEEEAPAWLLAWTLLAVAATALLLWVETQSLRPFYAVGDESLLVRSLVAISQGGPMQWRMGHGDLERNALWWWWQWAGSGPGRLLGLGLLISCLELALLALLARRWWGAETAAWALCIDLLCADSWMRARSLMSFHWLPAEALLLAWLSGRVRSRWAALLWGAAAAGLLLDYEGALLALPGLVAACLSLEPGFRRRWPWVLGALAAGMALIWALQFKGLVDYENLREAVTIGQSRSTLALSWARNLWELAAGGTPLPYFSVQHWPSVAAWALPLLPLGAVLAWRSGRRALVFWAALAVLASQASLSPYGVPAHRLAAAWPALCLLGGAGATWARVQLGPRAWLWMGLLLSLGAVAELDAFNRHNARFGERVWGPGRNMATAAGIVAQNSPPDVSIDTALMEAVRPTIAFHLAPRAGQGQRAWVLLPAELRCVAGAAGKVFALHDGMDDEPVLLLQAEGAQARRFDGMEKDLRSLLPLPPEPVDIKAKELAWLAKGGHDPWAKWTVCAMNLRTYWLAQPVDPGVLEDVLHSQAPIPAPWALAGRYVLQQKKAYGLGLLDHALDLDPFYSPALLWKAAALRGFSRTAEADAAQALAGQRQHEGHWLVGE
jgi:hypothetical protein